MNGSTMRMVLAKQWVVLVLVSATAALAGTSGTTSLLTVQGSASGSANGDFVSNNGGGALNTFYRWFIEVPPGLGQMVVEVFDADVGGGGAAEANAGRDRSRAANGAFTGSVRYTLLRPDGSQAAQVTCTAAVACPDNAWLTLLNSTTMQNRAAGHWELRVDMSSAITTADDINAYAIRAHDGTAGAGGTELNIYADSMVNVGANPPPAGTASRTYTFYPYVTQGCTLFKNDYDWDSNSGATGSMSLSSRTGSFNPAFNTMSATTVWRRDASATWTSDNLAVDYGMWTNTTSITSYLNGGTPNGNYATFYFSNSTAAAPPPTANPVTNAFRVYVATDAAARPAKPYMDQQLQYVSGPNPPQRNQTTQVRVRIRLINPAPFAVTFSAANNLIANVPGANATYAGTPTQTQGSLVSQPAVGGTGDVRWNPGSLASGATAVFTYLVNVRPTGGGQPRVVVTGQNAAGTRATYLDETQSTQARATFTFGPLCPLALTVGTRTRAVVSDFVSSNEAGRTVRWLTRSEDGTAGFNLWRDVAGQRRLLTPTPLLGTLGAGEGGRYAWHDVTAPAGPAVYWVEELELSGDSLWHGPFATQAVVGEVAPPREVVSQKPIDSLDRDDDVGDAPPAEPPVAGAALVGVSHSGLYRLEVGALASKMGVARDELVARVRAGRVRVHRAGHDLAWFPDNSGYAIDFYAAHEPSVFGNDTTFFVELGEGSLAVTRTDAASAQPVESAPATVRAERDAFAGTTISPDPNTDFFFWEFLTPGDPVHGTMVFPVSADHVVRTEPARLRVDLYAGTASTHRLKVAFNGLPVGQVEVEGISRTSAEFELPPGLVAEGANRVTLTAVALPGAALSIVYADGFSLSYRRALVEKPEGLEFSPPSAGQATVEVNSALEPWVLDVTQPWATERLTFSRSAHAVRFPVEEGRRYAVASRFEAPAWVRSARTSPIGGPEAELLIVTPRTWASEAERLAQLRRQSGLSSRVVTLEDLTDVYGRGDLSPYVVSRFVKDAWTTWLTPPKYVVLLGAGTYDYRDRLGLGGNVIPPLMSRTANGLFAADALVGDADGDDGVPEVSVGRLPVRTKAEARALVDKLIAYEATPEGGWEQRALMMSDAVDPNIDFGAASVTLREGLPQRFAPESMSLDGSTVESQRMLLLPWLNAGGALVNYVGHGSLDRFSNAGLLKADDAKAMHAEGKHALFVALTCGVNRFDNPRFRSLGEALVMARGGAVGMFGPTSLSVHPDAVGLGAVFFPALGTPGARVGDAMLAALRSQPMTPELLTYSLLGDPSLTLKGTPDAPEQPVVFPPPEPVTETGVSLLEPEPVRPASSCNSVDGRLVACVLALAALRRRRPEGH